MDSYPPSYPNKHKIKSSPNFYHTSIKGHEDYASKAKFKPHHESEEHKFTYPNKIKHKTLFASLVTPRAVQNARRRKVLAKVKHADGKLLEENKNNYPNQHSSLVDVDMFAIAKIQERNINATNNSNHNSSQVLSKELLYKHLQKVSRSFALTIPLVGNPLQDYISIAYLLCRVVDTIEDDATCPRVDKITWLSDFSFLASDEFEDENVLKQLKLRALELTNQGSSYDDIALIKDLELVVNLLKTYPDEVKEIIFHGVSILAHGMASFLRRENELGSIAISSLDDVDNYCYFVAGVVGEMLAELFITQDKKANKRTLMELAVSFGEGLQLTNILRDRSEDAKRGARFLPHCEEDLQEKLILDYVALTQGHLDDAINFICTLSPRYSYGVRLFCFTNVAMAMLINRKISRAPLQSKSNYSISRSSVKRLFFIARLVAHSNVALKISGFILSFGMRKIRRNARKLRDKVSIWDHSSTTN